METKKTERRSNYLRVILVFAALFLILSGTGLWYYQEQIFGSENEELAEGSEVLAAGEEEPPVNEAEPDEKAEEEKAPEEKSQEVPSIEQAPEETPPPAPPAPPAEEEEGPSLQFVEVEALKAVRPKVSDEASLQLVKNYLTVTGGKDAHQQLENIMVTGEIREGTRTKRFRLIETQDGKRHITYWWRLLGRDYEEVYVFDGGVAWMQRTKPEAEDAQPYAGQDALHFSNHRWLLQPFVLPTLADYVFKYQGGARVNGRPTHIVVGFGKKDERTWFYFDKEKFLLLRWGGYGLAAGKKEPMDYAASSFKKVSGVLLPSELSLIVEDGVFGRATFDSIEANVSLDQINFLIPGGTVPVLRQRPVQLP